MYALVKCSVKGQRNATRCHIARERMSESDQGSVG